jgi:hypothetical protein
LGRQSVDELVTPEEEPMTVLIRPEFVTELPETRGAPPREREALVKLLAQVAERPNTWALVAQFPTRDSARAAAKAVEQRVSSPVGTTWEFTVRKHDENVDSRRSDLFARLVTQEASDA